jgi:hypothetical protein
LRTIPTHSMLVVGGFYAPCHHRPLRSWPGQRIARSRANSIAADAGTATGGILRIRYHDIRPDRFSWTADRSADSGKTWVSPYQTIEARRIGAARSLGALAPARQ